MPPLNRPRSEEDSNNDFFRGQMGEKVEQIGQTLKSLAERVEGIEKRQDRLHVIISVVSFITALIWASGQRVAELIRRLSL